MELKVRCFAEQRKSGWYAHCIDLTLDAQGATYAQARTQLDEAIAMYLEWADSQGLTPSDALRRSPVQFRLRYYRAVAVMRLRAAINGIARRSHSGTPPSAFTQHPQFGR